MAAEPRLLEACGGVDGGCGLSRCGRLVDEGVRLVRVSGGVATVAAHSGFCVGCGRGGGDWVGVDATVKVTKMVTDMWWGGEDAAVRWRWRWWPAFGVAGGWPEWVAAPET
ncbi:hypothetical protein Tco_0593260 [Tanacetum coccineum]